VLDVLNQLRTLLQLRGDPCGLEPASTFGAGHDPGDVGELGVPPEQVGVTARCPLQSVTPAKDADGLVQAVRLERYPCPLVGDPGPQLVRPGEAVRRHQRTGVPTRVRLETPR